MNKRRHTYQLVAVIASLLTLAGAMPSDLFAQTAAVDMATGKQGMVATAHPLASQAALEVLKEGGNAVDAAVAAAFAIGVVEPDGSGLGGGGSMVIYMNDTKQSSYINYYHRTSGIIDRIDYRGDKDRTTAKSILVPGTVAGLTQALQQFGRLPLAQVIEPAIRLAGDGFPVDATLAQLMLDNLETIQSDSATAAIFLADGFPRMEGDTLRQPELANTLKIIAEKGQRGFYTGPVAEGIVKRVTELGGALTIDDMANYTAELLAPVEGTYRGCRIISAAAPQSGSTIIQSLNMLENENIAAMGHFSTSAKTLHFMAETLRRSYADRWQYLGDPQFTYVPVNGIINKEYARQRVDDINLYRAEPKQYRLTQAGNPEPFDQSRTTAGGSRVQSGKAAKGWDDGLDESGTNRGGFDENMFDSWGGKKAGAAVKEKKPANSEETPSDTTDADDETPDDNGYDGGHTTHLSVIDGAGNMVALTQTLGTFFGSGITAEGVLLNCGMSNFSESATPNLVEPNKQPRSSICPTVVLKDGQPLMVVGSPGASRIICTVVEVMVNVIDFHMNADEANAAPRFFCEKFEDFLFTEGGIGDTVCAELERMGHTIRRYEGQDLFFGGVQVIVVDQATGTYYGSADKRRGGVAIGY